MRIKVAYDTTTLMNEYGQSDCKSGIYTETEEIMQEFSQMSDVDLTLVCICCDNASLAGALQFSRYIKSSFTNQNYNSTSIIRSRLGLTSIYDKFYDFDLTSQNFYKLQLPKYSLISLLNRVKFKLIRKTFSIFSYLDYYSSFEHEKFDIFHSTYHKLPPKELTKNLPRVLTIQDLIPIVTPELVSESLIKYFKEIIASIDLQNDWVICISEYTRKQFCEYTGMPPERTFVTPLAAASHFYPVDDPAKIANVCHRYGIPEGDYFLCLASRLAPHKNVDRLIRCFFKLISEHPQLEINLVLAGSTRFQQGESNNHTDCQFNTRLVYTGYVADEDLNAIYSGATAFIFPSLFEGFGLPPLEAMQCGTPVIASNTTSLPEVVLDAGIAVDPLDENAICQAMLDLATDSNLVQELRRKGLERAKNFSWAKCAADTVEVYKKILSHRSRC